MDERVRIILKEWFEWTNALYYQNPNIVADMWGHTGYYGNFEGSVYHKGDFFTNDVSALELFKHDKWPRYWYIIKDYCKEKGIYYQIRTSGCLYGLISESNSLAEAISIAVLRRIEQCQKKP
jgi:hypothetical protein